MIEMNLGLFCNTISLLIYVCVSSGARTLQLSQRIFGQRIFGSVGKKVAVAVIGRQQQFLKTDIMTEWASAGGSHVL